MDIKDKLNEYIKNEYVNDNWIEELFSFKNLMCEEDSEDIDTYIDENIENYTFKELLFKYIDDKDLKDADVYNKVHIDRR